MRKISIYLLFAILVFATLCPFLMTARTIFELFHKVIIFLISAPAGLFLAQSYQFVCKWIAGKFLSLKCIAYYLYPKLYFNGKEKFCRITEGFFGFMPPIFFLIPSQKRRAFFTLYFTIFFSFWVVLWGIFFLLKSYYLLTLLAWGVSILVANGYYAKSGLDAYYSKCAILADVAEGRDGDGLWDIHPKEYDYNIILCYATLYKNSEELFPLEKIRKLREYEQLNILFFLLQKNRTKNVLVAQKYFNEIVNFLRGHPAEAILLADADLVFSGIKKAKVSWGLGLVSELISLIE
ncbi:hypothetical protein [Streptococcus ruminantium]|uniref:hypothetical protein n=1 Tax=Streptococcus ruminantium TaxID=1917441 RepID=UPI0012DBD7B4|nr:hypothetical protein [Streptococcus ruminantium]